MMYASVKPLSKYLRLKSVRIYDPIFTLHSKCTIVILLTCSILLSAKQYFGEPILCISERHNEFVQSFCWTMGTYVLPLDNSTTVKTSIPTQIWQSVESINMSRMRELVAHNEQYARALTIAEGVGPEVRGITKRLYLRYYQWVFIILLFQSILFYFPSYLWKVWEGQRMKQLCSEVCDAIIMDNVYHMRLQMLVKYFRTDFADIHLCYALKYLFCEVLNVLISLLNFWLMDEIFDGFWYKYIHALAAIPAYNWDLWNMMTSRVFPKVSKCEMFIYGPSGTPCIMDILCVLPLNILNEKIFAVLYIWFLFIAVLAIINILYRLVLIYCKHLRLLLIHTHLLGLPRSKVARVHNELSYGDWFVLMNVGINVNPALFREMFKLLAEPYLPSGTSLQPYTGPVKLLQYTESEADIDSVMSLVEERLEAAGESPVAQTVQFLAAEEDASGKGIESQA